MPETYVTTEDSRLFVDVRGEPEAPPVLYLHGGPGMSCYTFMHWQAPLLSRTCRVVGMDQRGVLRSDPLPDGVALTDEALVADCEAVREALGIERWAVLGHSFGGRVALQYAVRHPERISTVVFENPCWDFAETERLRLAAAAPIFAELGDELAARRCAHLVKRLTGDGYWRETIGLLAGLQKHGRYDELYFHQPESLAAFQAIDMSALFDDTLLSRARRHFEEGFELCAQPVTHLLPHLTVPAALLVGRYDLVTGPVQVAAFRDGVPRGEVHEFTASAHFAQLEEADAYAELVTGMVTTGL
jgi:proline iminopeptidase